jgi:class 3 adenylate cyclase/tetratricopeptide (TPR) repeat protein
MFSDICGYSRAMAADEAQALRLLREHNLVVLPLVERWGGRVLKLIGDAVLAAFTSSGDAAGCAIAIQKTLMARNRGVPEGAEIVIRIGLHAGDVVEEAGDVFGGSVNIAARLEGLAQPGRICISRAIHDALAAQSWPVMESIGLHDLKNIPGRFHLYEIDPEASELPEPPDPLPHPTRTRAWIVSAMVGTVLAIASVFVLVGGPRSGEDTIAATAGEERLVVGVCLFAADPALEPLARSLQRMILFELNRSPATEAGLQVLPCEMSPTSHEEAISLEVEPRPQMIVWGDVALIGEDIAMQGMLSLLSPIWQLDLLKASSVHFAGDNAEALRAGRAQAASLSDLVHLVEAAYFRVTNPQLALMALGRISEPTSTSKALEGMVFYYLDRFEEAKARFAAALELDAEDAVAASALALVFFKLEDWEASIRHSEQAKALRPDLSWPYGNLSRVYQGTGDLERAAAEARAGLAIAPDSFLLRTELATVHLLAGASSEARDELERAIGENPNYDHAQLLFLFSLLELDDVGAARAHLQSLAKTPPRMREVYRALLQAADEDGDEAFETAAALVAAQPAERRCRASFYAGMIHELGGRAGEADPFYAWSARHCPSWAPHGALAKRRQSGQVAGAQAER